MPNTSTRTDTLTNSPDLQVVQAIWRLPCPCGGIIHASRGEIKKWVLACTREGGGLTMLRAVAEFYSISVTQLLDGPYATPDLPWQMPRPKGPPDPQPTREEFTRWRKALWRNKAALAYLHDKRGLTDKTIRNAMLGYGQPNPNRPAGIVIPIPPHDPVTFRTRLWPDPWFPPGGGKEVKILTPYRHEQRPYPSIPSGGLAVLCEGELDALLTRQRGLPAVGVPGCMLKPQIATQIALRATAVAVCFDVGVDKQAARAVRLLRREGADAWQVDIGLPNKGEDLTDFFVTYKRTADQLRSLINKSRRKPVVVHADST